MIVCSNCLEECDLLPQTETFFYEYWGSKESKTDHYYVTTCCQDDEGYEVDDEHYDLFIRYLRRYKTHPPQISKRIDL